jgi:hypothetical protein
MKKYICIAVLTLSLLAVISYQHERIKIIKEDRDAYKQSAYTLLSDIEQYQTTDSLYVASINELVLTANEYKKYRADDMKLIETLKVDKKRLEQITSVQTQTIYELSGTVRDSIVYRDNYVTDTLKCVNISNFWFDLNGCIEANSKFAGTFEGRDSLLYVEHIIPKQFWFIKWGVKERRQEIVSRNPYTKIISAEFITIRK